MTKSILAVDDDKDLLFFIFTLLKSKGYTVRMLADCKKILEVLEKNMPDLIILDINLGACDGHDICSEVKKIKLYTHIPIILYSANIYEKESHLVCGAAAFIEKPFSNQHLVETIQKFCPQ